MPLVVFNPLNIAREDVVEASVDFPADMPNAVRVTGPDGKDVPAQISDGKVIFLAERAFGRLRRLRRATRRRS